VELQQKYYFTNPQHFVSYDVNRFAPEWFYFAIFSINEFRKLLINKYFAQQIEIVYSQ